MITRKDMCDYKEWKNWHSKNFARSSVEETLYFSKLRNKFKLGDNLNVLEIGFGGGSFLDFSRANSWNISGVELNTALLDNATQHGFEVFDSIYNIPESNQYDLVVAFDVFEHVETDDFIKFLGKIKNFLSSNGIIIARAPNGSSPLGLANQHGDITHLSIITESKMNYWTSCVDLKIDYSGGDIYLVYNGKILKTPVRAVKRIFQLIIERTVRWIFSPQSKGCLSANSLYVLSLKNNES